MKTFPIPNIPAPSIEALELKPGSDITQAVIRGSGKQLVLSAGEYMCSPVRLPRTISIVGAGKEKTKITLMESRSSSEIVSLFTDHNTSMFFELDGLTIDANWKGFMRHRSRMNFFKLQPIFVRAWNGSIRNVAIENFGAKGKDNSGQYAEAFPIAAHGYSGGPSSTFSEWIYLPQFKSLEENEPTPFWEILNCDIRDPHFENGGYCTGIIVQTNQINAGDRMNMGDRGTMAAVVRNNTVNVPGGIAYGCAWSENVLFDANSADDCAAAFNFDTGRALNIELRNNEFKKCNTGINFTGSGDLSLLWNTLEVIEPFYNVELGRDDPQFAVKLGKSSTLDENDENILHAENASDLEGRAYFKLAGDDDDSEGASAFWEKNSTLMKEIEKLENSTDLLIDSHSSLEEEKEKLILERDKWMKEVEDLNETNRDLTHANVELNGRIVEFMSIIQAIKKALES